MEVNTKKPIDMFIFNQESIWVLYAEKKLHEIPISEENLIWLSELKTKTGVKVVSNDSHIPEQFSKLWSRLRKGSTDPKPIWWP